LQGGQGFAEGALLELLNLAPEGGDLGVGGLDSLFRRLQPGRFLLAVQEDGFEFPLNLMQLQEQEFVLFRGFLE